MVDPFGMSRRRNHRRLRAVGARENEEGPVVVLHLFGRMGRGGAEIRTVQLLDYLDPDSVHLIFGTLLDEPEALDDEIRRHGSEVVPIPRRPLWRWPLLLRRVVRQYGVSVVHSHVATASGALLASAWLVGVPRRIAHFRSDSDGRGSSLTRRSYRWLMRRLIALFATDVVAVSPSALAFSGQPVTGPAWWRGPRTMVIPSGLDTEELRRGLEAAAANPLGDAVQGAVLMNVGRPDPTKNRPRAVSILRACLARGMDISLVIVGDVTESEAAELEDMLGDAKDRMVMLGERSDVPALVASADVLLMTSSLEGLPGVVLEACALGTPSVASDLPGVRWIAEQLEGVTPLPLASPDERWVDAIEEALLRPRDMAARQEALRSLDDSDFSMRRAVAAFEALWRRQ